MMRIQLVEPLNKTISILEGAQDLKAFIYILLRKYKAEFL